MSRPKSKGKQQSTCSERARLKSSDCFIDLKVRNAKTGKTATIRKYHSNVSTPDTKQQDQCPECGGFFYIGAGRMVGSWVEAERPLESVAVCPRCACKLTNVTLIDYNEPKEKIYGKGSFFIKGTYRETEQICKFVDPLYNLFVNCPSKDADGWFQMSNDAIVRGTGCRYPTELLSVAQKIKYVEICKSSHNSRKIRLLDAENHVSIFKRILELVNESTEADGYSRIFNKTISDKLGIGAVNGLIEHLVKEDYLERGNSPKKNNERLLRVLKEHA